MTNGFSVPFSNGTSLVISGVIVYPEGRAPRQPFRERGGETQSAAVSECCGGTGLLSKGTVVIYVYIYLSIYLSLYIYIYREREIDRSLIYIYI